MRTFKQRFSRAALLGALLCGLAPCPPAWAQRAGENVLNTAQDAFGTTVGSESVGLYNSGSARGFSPIQAGNVRIEGLFFHIPAAGGGLRLSNRLFRQTSIHVGLSAQSYPFPSPTGIADYSLRLPGEEYVVSAVARLGPKESIAAEVDAQIPIVKDAFSLGIGLSGERTIADHGPNFYKWSGAVIGRWRVDDNIEVIPFWSQLRLDDNEFAPWIFTGGPYYPPKYKRSTPLVPEWSEINERDSVYGVSARAAWSDWLLRAGVFRAVGYKPETRLTLYFNTQPDGTANRQFWSFSGFQLADVSTSAETRLSRVFAEGPRRHTASLNVRGRNSIQGTGGVTRVDAGTAILGVPDPAPVPQPVFATAPRNREHVRQGSIGASYEGQWRNVGEFSAGLQRVFYERNTSIPVTHTAGNYWLYNATLAAYLSEEFVLYSSYTRGLEDSPNAPAVSANEGRGVAASVTQQVDAGFRYNFGPSLKLVAGVFEVKKPFFDLDTANVYRELGTIRHQGIEASLTGAPFEGVRVVAGLVLLKARISGELVEQGVIGKIPADSAPVTLSFNVQYALPRLKNFSVDATFTYDSDYFADIQNTFKGEALANIDLGARYRFSAYDTPATLRLQVTNVLNTYKWRIAGNQRLFRPTAPRKVIAQVTVDF